MKKRNRYSAEFKTKVVLEVLRVEATVNEIAARYEISPVMIGRWKQDFLSRAPEVFKKGPSEAERDLAREQDHVADLERKVGQLTYEVDRLKKNLKKSLSVSDRKSLAEPDNKKINIKRQAKLLSVNRTSLYRNPPVKVISDEELYIMRRLDELNTAEPT